MQKMLGTLDLSAIKIDDPFFSQRIDTAIHRSIPYMWEALNDRVEGVPPSHCIHNLKIAAGEMEGAFQGPVFQDSDVYKWLEAAAFSLSTHKDPELESTIDEFVGLLGRVQREDGYLDSYYIGARESERWTNLRDNHELYIAGHMMEAAVAYYRATGKRALLDIACRTADHIDATFGTAQGKKRGYPGHQEVEIGLVKLYEATGEARYLKLAQYFLDERGAQPFYFDSEPAHLDKRDGWRNHGPMPYSYMQAHLPVREQETVTGHAVRAGYMFTAMADVAARTGDATLLDAARRLWEDVTNRQMYITGGVGSMGDGEAFTFDYDLPNDAMYNETCASIALMMFSQRMQRIERHGKYADIVELALYNGVLSGISLDGTKYFYVNPMESWPERPKGRNECTYVAERQGWFGCACCPPNILRTMTGLGDYIYSADADALYVNLFVGSEATHTLAGERVTVRQAGKYPWDGAIRITLGMEKPARFTLALRVPGWCDAGAVKLMKNGTEIDVAAVAKHGYAHIEGEFRDGDVIEYTLPMEARRVYASDRCPADAGKVAVMRGPLVFCIEEEENGQKLWNVCLPKDAELTAAFDEELMGGMTRIKARGMRQASMDPEPLYTTQGKTVSEWPLTFVPYFAWCNRTPGEMATWLREC